MNTYFIYPSIFFARAAHLFFVLWFFFFCCFAFVSFLSLFEEKEPQISQIKTVKYMYVYHEYCVMFCVSITFKLPSFQPYSALLLPSEAPRALRVGIAHLSYLLAFFFLPVRCVSLPVVLSTLFDSPTLQSFVSVSCVSFPLDFFCRF